MLIMDDRENDLLIHKIIVRMGDAEHDAKGIVKVKRLVSADYIIGKVGIEAKEINDLYHSIMGHGRSRTIIAQLSDLQENFEKPMLVVYGTQLKPFIPGNRRPNRQIIAQEHKKMQAVIKKFKMDFLMKFPKIQFMQLESMDDFVDFLGATHKYVRIRNHMTSAEPEEVSRVKSRSPFTHPSIAALSSIHGITDRMAHDLLIEFGSLRHILRLKTSQRKLMAIAGIGRTRAQAILALRNPYPDQPTEKNYRPKAMD